MENKEFYSIFPELGREVFEEKIEKPLERYLHANSNVICMNSMNTVIANAIEKSKLGEAGFDKHDIFSSPALVEKIRSDDILSPIGDNSNDICDPHPFKIPMKIVERAMNNCYLGDGTIHPGDHLLFIHELCELFKFACISTSQVKRKLFSLSLKGRAAEWYKTPKDGQSIGLEEIVPLFYSKFYPSSEIHKDKNYIYNFHPHDGESIAQAWGRLKALMLKCPIHELPRNIIIINFYARLSGHYKNYLDACFEGSFISKEVDAKWDLLEIIQSNIKDWDCIKSFAETTDFQELSDKYGLDPQIMVDFDRAFASHINVPKGNRMCIINLLKTLAWKVKFLLMIAMNMLKLPKVLFLISLLIFVEHLDLVKRITSKKIIVSNTGVKKLECGTRL
jgi:hypothetical protein